MLSIHYIFSLKKYNVSKNETKKALELLQELTNTNLN